jgi:hypothetical protein
MPAFHPRIRALAVGASVVALVALGVGGTVAASNPATLYACYDTNGNVRMSDSAICKLPGGGRLASWGTAAVPGPTGPVGPTGPQGVPGPVGATGAIGPVGATGQAGYPTVPNTPFLASHDASWNGHDTVIFGPVSASTRLAITAVVFSNYNMFNQDEFDLTTDDCAGGNATTLLAPLAPIAGSFSLTFPVPLVAGVGSGTWCLHISQTNLGPALKDFTVVGYVP